MIPNEYHFIFGLTPNGKPFSFIHYLAVMTCQAVNQPDTLNFYYQYEPSGFWWEKAKPYLKVAQIEAPTEIFGNAINHPAHMADVLRLQILLERGGIYLDVDVLCLRPFAPLRKFDFVLGEECGVGLGNAVILARPGAEFLRRWIDTYNSFSSEAWNRHSVIVPAELARENPDQIHIADYRDFYWPMYWGEHLRAFFLNPGSVFSRRSYCIHLWENLTWSYLQGLNPARLYVLDSEFGRLMRRYVDPNWWYPGEDSTLPIPRVAAAVADLRAIVEQFFGHDGETSAKKLRSQLTHLRQYLRRVSTPDREVLVLCVLMGVPPAEAARALGCDEGLVHSRLNRRIPEARGSETAKAF